MRLRSPAEYYIKALLVDSPPTLESVKEQLLDEGLDFISMDYLERLNKKLRSPKPFYPRDARHMASFTFIVKEGINRFFLRDLNMRTAFEILKTPRAREFVETMIIADVPLLATASYVTRQRGIRCTPEALEAYRHYFWNINLLDSSQLRVLMQLRIDTAATELSEYQGRGGKTALRSAYYKDSRKIAADLPHSPTSAMIAQMRLGLKPTRVDLARSMIEARDVAIVRAIEAAQQDGPGDSQKFFNYVSGSRMLEELVQMVVRPEDQTREQLTAIALRNDNRTLPSIHQLSGGQHTVDQLPKDSDYVDTTGTDAGKPEGRRDPA